MLIRQRARISVSCNWRVKNHLSVSLYAIFHMLISLESPELVFGLCSPVGTNNDKIVELLTVELNKYQYNVHVFKVTQLMKAFIIPGMSLIESPIDKKYETYIAYADELRRLFDDSSILASICCAAAHAHRKQKIRTGEEYIPKQAYIFDQFKRSEEIASLRQTYGQLFVLVSICSEKETRLKRLSDRISADRQAPRPIVEDIYKAGALIHIDEEEEHDLYGQRLRETFPLADVFINVDDLDGAENTLDRFMKALFGSNSISPSPDEYGMYIAKSASLRSLDLSRQVGAAIFTNRTEIVSLGCNEVPKAGGGSYWCTDEGDARDFVLEHDENERIKKTILTDIVVRLSGVKGVELQGDLKEITGNILKEAETPGSPIKKLATYGPFGVWPRNTCRNVCNNGCR